MKLATQATNVVTPEWLSDPVDQRLQQNVKDIRTVAGGIRVYSQDIDLSSVNANATSDLTVLTPPGTIKTGEYVCYVGAANLNHGLVVQGCIPGAGDDTFTLRVSNVTAAAIDATAKTFYFIIVGP